MRSAWKRLAEMLNVEAIPPDGYVASPNPIARPRHAPNSAFAQDRYRGDRGTNATTRIDARWKERGSPDPFAAAGAANMQKGLASLNQPPPMKPRSPLSTSPNAPTDGDDDESFDY